MGVNANYCDKSPSFLQELCLMCFMQHIQRALALHIVYGLFNSFRSSKVACFDDLIFLFDCA